MSKMRIAGVGINEGVEWQIDPSHRAGRVSLRPVEYGANGGAYSLSFASGIMAAALAAGSVIFSFRWPLSMSLIGFIRRVRLTAATDVTAFAQGATIFDMVRAIKMPSQYTAGAAITISGKDGARATRFASNPIQIAGIATGDIAVASTAALAAGAPAPTLDSQPLGILVGSVGAVPESFPVAQPGLLYDPTEAGKQPLELMPLEGFVIRATVPATGTWKFGVEVDYDAIDPQRFYTL